MKLHLPKRLLTALLAAFTAISLSTGSAAWANTGLHNNVNYLLGGTGAGDTAQGTYTGLQETTIDARTTTLVTTINAEALTSFNLWADDNGNAWTNALVGSLRVQDKATINISESQWKGTGDVVRYFNELHIANLNIAGEGSAVLNVSLANHNVSIDSVNGTLSSVTNAGNLTLGSNGGSVTLGGNITNTGTLTLRGNVYGTSTITGGTVNLVDFSAAGNLSFGAVQVSGVLGMSSSGHVAWDSLELAEGAILEYGKGANTLNIGTIGKNVTLYLYEVEEKLRSENGVNLGISLGEGQTLETLKSYLSIDGLTSGASFDLIERDGSVYLTSTGTLDSGWDNRWGAGVLRDRPTSSVQIVDPTGLSDSTTNGNETYLMIQGNFTDGKLVSVELTGSGDYSANAVIVGGFATTTSTNSQGSVERDVWIKATAGQYKAIVGGNVADNWGGGNAAHFTGDTHILVNGATVGAIIGGTYRDGKAPKFTGDTYISVLSGDVKDCIFGAAANTHNNTTTFNGNTNIFVYVPLVNTASGYTIGKNGAINAIVGGAGKVANDANDAKSYINGNTNVTIDLSGYTGEATTFVKQIVGGSKNIVNSYYAEINGNTYVNIVGKEGITFTKEVIGGSAFGTAGTATINGSTHVQISGGTFTGAVVGGSYATSNSTNTVLCSSVQISGGSFSGSLVGGNLVSGNSSNTVGSSSVQISGGSFTNEGNTGGNGDAPYSHLIVGGSMLTTDIDGTSLLSDSTQVVITGGSIATDIYGGHVDLTSGSSNKGITATLQNATVTLNGTEAQVANIYGGSFTKRDNLGDNAVITQGAVLVDLIAGTVNGNVYAAGRQLHRTKISTETTEVRISDTVEFTSDSALVSGGYQMGCTGHPEKAGENPSVVTGTKTLVFTGGSQDRSGITFDSFDTFEVVTSGAVVTIDSLTNISNLNKTGAGTLKLSGVLGAIEELDISAGVVEADCADNLTFSGNISGSGVFAKSGSGALTLDSSKISVNNLKVNAGEIIYNSTTDTSHTLTGAAGSKFTKIGSGTLTVSSESYNGDIEVSAGTLKFDGSADSSTDDPNRKITIQTGAALDINGKARHYEVVMQEDATLTNTGAAIGDDQRQLHTITLNGDATVSGTGNLYLINNGYSTTFLNLNQHTLTKTGTNTFYLKNTTVQSDGVIRVEEGTVQTMSTAAGILDISKASLEIADAGSFVLAEKSQQIQNLTLEAGGTLTINSGLTLTTMGDVTWNGGAISGNLCLNGTVSQTGGTVDLSNAVLSGTSLTQFDKVGDATLPTESGLYAATYKLIDGSISLTSGEQSAQSTIIVGGHSYALNLNAGTFAVNSNYYVASDDSITISSESGEDPISQATYFYVDGTLNVAGVAGNATTVKDILAYSGGTGKLVLKTEATFTNSIHTVFNGTLSIGEGGTLNFGYAKAAGSDMSSFSKVELDGGTLNYNNLDSTLNNFTVTQNGGAMYVADYKDTYITPILLAGTTDIQGDFVYKTEYKSYLQIEELTGDGTLTITTETNNNHNDRGAHVQIDSLSDFTGNIMLDPEHNSTNRVEVTAALAKGETLKSSQITINDANKSSFILTGSGLYDMVDSVSDKKVSGLDQAAWTGTVKLGNADTGTYDLRLLGNAGSTIQIAEGCTFKTYLNNTNAEATHTTFDSAFQLDGDLVINDGWSTRTYIFSGKIAGEGNLIKSSSITSRYNFTNNISGWNGELENKVGTLTVTLQELASTVYAAITRSGGTLNLNVETTNAATFANAVSVNALTLNQSATFTGSLTATTISVASGKTLTLDNGTTTLGATISGSGGLIKSGTGTLTLSGANTYSGGTTISGGLLEITSTSALGSSTTSIADKASLLINTGNSGSITFTANKRLTGAGTMEIASGSTVNVGSSTNNGSAQVQTNVKINGGATLNLTGADALGWGGTATKKITLLGSGAEEGQLAKLTAVGTQTMKTSLDLQGNTKVSGGAFEFFDGSITASGKNNVISSAIYSRNNGTITVTGADDELEVSGNFANRDNYAALITKSGLGTLTISGATNMFHKGFTVGEGKVVVSGTGRTTVQGGVLTISTGAEMEVGANLHVSAGANLGGIISVTGGTADFNGAFTASGANANLTQSGTGVVNLNGDILVESNAGLTLNGVVGIGSTITNNGTLTFTNSITIAGELSSFDTYDNGSEGQVTYVGIEGNARLDGNGFEKVSGLSYWLTSKDSSGTVNYGDITHVSHGSNAYTLNEEGKNLYFTVESNIGSIFFVKNADEVAEVSVADAAHATGFDICNGGSLSLAAGAETNANATIRLAGNSSINLAAGSTLHTFAKEGSGTLTLTGSGTYDLGSGVANLGSGISLGSSWTGTVRLTDVVASGMNFETYGNVASKVALNGVSGWFDRSTNNNVHIILEEKGLTFSDFSSDDNYTFVKGISGAGNFIIDAHDNANKTVTATPTIRIGVNEDASLTWSGKFQVNDIRTDSASNPGEAFVRLYLNGNGSYFDSTAASAGVEMNDSVGTLKVFVGHATSADNAKEDTDFTPGDGLTTINGFVKNNSTGRLELTALNNTVFNKMVDVTSMTVNSGKTATMNSTLKAGTLKLGDTATITKAEGKDTASMQNVKLSEEGIASADETGDTKGTVSDAKVTLAALAAGTSFSIEDVTLSNVNIEAANAEDRVNLSGVSATDVQLTKGEFHMLDKAQLQQVGTGGSAINLVEGGPTGLQFSTSLLNGMTLGADASMVVDLGDLSGFTGMSSGKPTFSITLEGFRLSDYTGTGENKGLYFASDSWLGQLLVAQGASQYVKGDSLEAGAQATAGSGSGVSVSYNSTAVGTVIIISGLKVPEPTTSTLGLIALSALAMRRRRK